MKWKKIIQWTLGVLAALLLLLGIGVYWVQHSQSFHQWALRKIVERAESATGARIEIRDFAIHWKALRVDLDGIVVHGSEGQHQIPLLAADHVEVGLKIISIFRRKVDLSELILTHPVFHLIEGPDGATNLPRRPNTGGTGTVNLFSLAIRHVAIVSGEFYYNNEKIPLSAELHDLQTTINFETLRQVYRGTLSYDRGKFAVKDYAPFEHAAKLQFEASSSQFSANPLDLTLSHSRFRIRATLKDYANPQIEGNYQAEVRNCGCERNPQAKGDSRCRRKPHGRDSLPESAGTALSRRAVCGRPVSRSECSREGFSLRWRRAKRSRPVSGTRRRPLRAKRGRRNLRRAAQRQFRIAPSSNFAGREIDRFRAADVSAIGRRGFRSAET